MANGQNMRVIGGGGQGSVRHTNVHDLFNDFRKGTQKLREGNLGLDELMYEYAARATNIGIGSRYTANELNFDNAPIKEEDDESGDDGFADLFAQASPS